MAVADGVARSASGAPCRRLQRPPVREQRSKARGVRAPGTMRRRDTEPLEFFFWERGLLREVDAEGTEDEVTERAVEALSDIAEERT